jgi:hypothetical protein
MLRSGRCSVLSPQRIYRVLANADLPVTAPRAFGATGRFNLRSGL